MTNLTNEKMTELDRFFKAAEKYTTRTGEPAYMPACVIDDCWHELLEDQKRYVSFTQNSINAEIEHVASQGHGVIAWAEDYEELFGSLSPLWFTRSDDQADLVAQSEYNESGVFKASWDCNPLIKKLRTGFNDNAYKEYKKSGEFKASWDCNPLIKRTKKVTNG